MKYAFVIAVLSSSVMVVSDAYASCGCQAWAKQMAKPSRGWSRLLMDVSLMNHGIPARPRRKIMSRIKDYAVDAALDPNFCERSKAHEKACKAFIACAAAAGPTYLAERALGKSTKEASEDAVTNCAIAAAGVFLVA